MPSSRYRENVAAVGWLANNMEVGRRSGLMSDLLSALTVVDMNCSEERQLGRIKGLLLVLESAMPRIAFKKRGGCLGGGKDMVGVWRESVRNARGPREVTEAMIHLENSVEGTWVDPEGSKLYGYLPTWSVASRNCSVGMVGVRCYLLDKVLLYGGKKPKFFGTGKKKGRPPSKK